MRRKNIFITLFSVAAIILISMIAMQSRVDVKNHQITTTDAVKTLPLGMADLGNSVFPNVPDELQTEPPFILADHKGRFVLINFWASWCAPCRVEFPDLLNFAKAHADKVDLIFVSNDDLK